MSGGPLSGTNSFEDVGKNVPGAGGDEDVLDRPLSISGGSGEDSHQRILSAWLLGECSTPQDQ